MIRLKPKKKIPKSEAYWQTLAVLQKARLAAKKKSGWPVWIFVWDQG